MFLLYSKKCETFFPFTFAVIVTHKLFNFNSVDFLFYKFVVLYLGTVTFKLASHAV